MPDFRNKVKFQNARAIKETLLAIMIEADWDIGPSRPLWFPKSQIDDDSEVWEEGQEGELVVSEWIAQEKKII